SPDGVFVEDLEGNVLDVNPAAVALQGIERERLIGMNVAQLVPAENRDEAMANFRRLASGEIDRIEGFTLTGGGRSIPVEVHVRSMEYSGEPALLIQVRDMTERKEHEAR
ncbi:MAG: PAS domain S-box protein, partial [Acidobacteria bacterium]|nr:PAS domain S-box protein [Acidobacteriota bacterium]